MLGAGAGAGAVSWLCAWWRQVAGAGAGAGAGCRCWCCELAVHAGAVGWLCTWWRQVAGAGAGAGCWDRACPGREMQVRFGIGSVHAAQPSAEIVHVEGAKCR